jgi:hypothetical protein
MNLVIYNGSPRGKNSNTDILLRHFTDGCDQTGGITWEKYYLKHMQNNREQRKAFEKADGVIIAFPLYTDSVPGIVKYFIESLKPLVISFKKIGFIVQSGFVESIHSLYVENYLEKLTIRLGCEYLGTIIKGGVEGIQLQPSHMTDPLFTAFFNLGRYFAETHTFHPGILSQLKKPDRLPVYLRLVISFLGFFGLTNRYWNNQLKENHAFKKRFDTPYA